MLTAGRAELWLTFIGTAAPFDVELTSPQGVVVAHQSSLRQHVLEVSAAIAVPGRYKLQLRDACGRGVEDDDIRVVAADQRPLVPEPLVNLPDPQRTLFYADYLIGHDDGRWRLEALQLVTALPRDKSDRRRMD